MHAELFWVFVVYRMSFLAKKTFRNTTRVSNNLDSAQAPRVFGPNLATDCLQRLSADDKTCHEQAKR